MNSDDDPVCYDRLDDATKAALKQWIDTYIQPAEQPYNRASRATPLGHTNSYGLKHDFQAMTGIYVKNGDFKGAMLASGYRPADPSAQNWHFYMRPAPIICPSCGKQVRVGPNRNRPNLGDLCSECRKARARDIATGRLRD